jgi:hypothetical protein
LRGFSMCGRDLVLTLRVNLLESVSEGCRSLCGWEEGISGSEVFIISSIALDRGGGGFCNGSRVVLLSVHI